MPRGNGGGREKVVKLSSLGSGWWAKASSRLGWRHSGISLCRTLNGVNTIWLNNMNRRGIDGRRPQVCNFQHIQKNLSVEELCVAWCTLCCMGWLVIGGRKLGVWIGMMLISSKLIGVELRWNCTKSVPTNCGRWSLTAGWSYSVPEQSWVTREIILRLPDESYETIQTPSYPAHMDSSHIFVNTFCIDNSIYFNISIKHSLVTIHFAVCLRWIIHQLTDIHRQNGNISSYPTPPGCSINQAVTGMAQVS